MDDRKIVKECDSDCIHKGHFGTNSLFVLLYVSPVL